MSKITCSCNEYPWRFYKAGESATNAHGDTSQPFLCDVWERVDDDLGLCTSQFALGEEGRFYCDRCGTLCTAKGTTEPQVPWARVVQAEKRMAEIYKTGCHGAANYVLGAGQWAGAQANVSNDSPVLCKQRSGEWFTTWLVRLARETAMAIGDREAEAKWQAEYQRCSEGAK